MTPTFSVLEITRIIKELLEAAIPAVQVEGEISNYKKHYSGHAYFTLKDSHAQLSSIMWRTYVAMLPFPLEDGMQVVCRGYLSVYEKTGRYQLIVQSMEETGTGDLHRRFEELKQKLYLQGYFDESHKQKIPAYPQRIGLVTSPTGAAIQDIISVAMRRNPSIQLILRPTQVQGIDAQEDIANAIQEFNNYGQVDVLIVGRGGGALEDLWAFNEERVAKAIYESPIPIVSAVGHEIDTTISDLVADMRAPTPSAAAELLIPQREEMQGQLRYYQERLYQLISNQLEFNKHRLTSLKSHYAFRKPEYLLQQKQGELKRLKERLIDVFRFKIATQTNQLQILEKQLHALSPQSILQRGFAIVHQEGRLIDRARKLHPGPITITFIDGQVERN